MAKVVTVGFDELAKELETLANHSGKIATSALYAGAGEMADRIRSSTEKLQTETERKHRTRNLLPYEKQALLDGLTVEKFTQDSGRDYTQTTVTFHGKTDHPTESYPDGLPTILLARSITKGTTFRRANRFFPNTVNRSRKEVEKLMTETAEREMKKHIK